MSRPRWPLLILLALGAIALVILSGPHALPLMLVAGPMASARAVDLREAALAKLLEAKALADDDGFVLPENERKFSAIMAEYRKLDEQAHAAAGIVDDQSALGAGLAHYAGQGTRMGAAPAFQTGNSAPGGRRPSIHRSSWGDAVLQAITGGTRMFAGVVGGGSVPVSVPLRTVPVTEARRLRFLRELIPSEPAPTGRFSYMKQTTRTNNAAVVAELSKKPTSVYTLTRVDDQARTIAHLSEPIPRQQLQDAPMLRQFVDDELRYGLDLALDSEILNGDGTGEHLEGFLEASGVQTLDGSGEDPLAITRVAITMLETNDLFPTGWVFNPSDWELVESVAMTQFAANPNMPGPTDTMLRRLWGLPVVTSNAITAGTALLGDFAGSAMLHPTEEARVDWSENVYDPNAISTGVGATDFERNAIRFRAECRYGLEISRPLGFVVITMPEA